MILRHTVGLLALICAAPLLAQQPPPNDNCANATLIGEGTFFGDVTDATHDGFASCAPTVPSNDVWYEFIAPCEGILTANTCGTHDLPTFDAGMDSVISVHLPCNVTVPTELACNDDHGSSGGGCVGIDFVVQADAYVEVPVSSGWTVLIRVANYPFDAPGSFVLNTSFECICNPVSNLVCPDGPTAVLTWTNQDNYTGINVYRDGSQIASVLPTETLTDAPLLPGTYTYEVEGICISSTGPVYAPRVACTVDIAPVPTASYLRGDCNGDGLVNIADAVFALGILFPVVQPNVPPCEQSCDSNDDGVLNIADVVRVLGALFGSMPEPLSAPYPQCGPDVDGIALTCVVETCP